MAYNNAVTALGKICQFHRDSIDSSQVYSFGNLLFLFMIGIFIYFNLGYAWGGILRFR